MTSSQIIIGVFGDKGSLMSLHGEIRAIEWLQTVPFLMSMARAGTIDSKANGTNKIDSSQLLIGSWQLIGQIDDIQLFVELQSGKPADGQGFGYIPGTATTAIENLKQSNPDTFWAMVNDFLKPGYDLLALNLPRSRQYEIDVSRLFLKYAVEQVLLLDTH